MTWLSGKKKSLASIGEALSQASSKVADTVSSVDITSVTASLKVTANNAAAKTKEVTVNAYSVTREKTTETYGQATESILGFDYSVLRRTEYYKETFIQYKDLGTNKVTEYFRSTFEVEKSTLEMVEGIRNTLPVPANTVDDIFEQCKREAMRRAIASFSLAGVMQDIDQHSAAKYANLSESYSDFSARTGNAMFDDPNFSAMKDTRYDAQQKFTQVENGYNKLDPLYAPDADIEHIVARKSYYNDLILRAGTTDDEFFSIINSKENLTFADKSLNRSLQDKNIYEYLAANGTPHPDNPDLIDVEIKSTGRIVTVSKSDIDEVYNDAEENRTNHRIDAIQEIGTTVAITGATMAAQQIVGLIVMETIDIFVDEIRDLTVNGKLINENGWMQNTKDVTNRIQDRLSERFEEKQIWTRAKSLGLEAGVSGALSVIPQILISLIVKMPAFILALVRECTLSLVRCIRIMLSKETSKLDAITIVLAGTASAIVGVYAGRVIGNAIAGIPVLNKFNPQITSVLTGLLVTAVPLAAIYTFDQNKEKLKFVTSRFAKSVDKTELDTVCEADATQSNIHI